MKIFILTMDEPIQTYDFIKKIIDHKKNDIIGLAVCKGDRLTIQKKKIKVSIFTIAPFNNGSKTFSFKFL